MAVNIHQLARSRTNWPAWNLRAKIVNGRFKTSRLWALQNQPGVRCSLSTVLPIVGLIFDQLTTRSWQRLLLSSGVLPQPLLTR